MAIDGGTSSHTAWRVRTLCGRGDGRRLQPARPATLRRHFRTAELGWDVGIHTCGDRAMDMVVDAFADVACAIPRPDARHHVIHALLPSDRALAQMAEHRIAAVIQPTFLYWEGDMIFRDSAERTTSQRKYLDAGVVLAPTPTSVDGVTEPVGGSLRARARTTWPLHCQRTRPSAGRRRCNAHTAAAPG